MSEEILGRLREAILSLNAPLASEEAQKGLDAGLDPLDIIDNGIRTALEIMGERFSDGDLFLPELVLSAKAADAAVAILEPELIKKGTAEQKLGRFLIATVKGDIHDIGKNIVSLLMKSAGFEVFDLGVDICAEAILKAAKENHADVIGLSALLTTTTPQIQEFLDLLEESGDRSRFKVILGGAPITQSFARNVGADGYAADAARAVEVTKQLLGI